MAGWLLLVACETRTGGRPEVAATPGAPQSDGGTPSCIGGGRFVSSAGTGSRCGIKPLLGAPRTARAQLGLRNPDGGPPHLEKCEEVLPADEAGNVLIESVLLNFGGPASYPGLYTFDSSGVPLAQAVAPVLTGPVGAYPLRTGWLLGQVPQSPSLSSFALIEYAPSLQAPSTVFEGGFPFSVPFPSPGGGTAAVAVASQLTPNAACPEPPGQLFATSFDASGAAVFRDAPLGCASGLRELAVARNATGDVLVLVDGTAWHVTPQGTVSQMVSGAPRSPLEFLHPLIDDRFALYDGRAWTATVDVAGNASPPPCWLQERSDVWPIQIVLGGQAYLAYHTGPLRDPLNPHPQSCDQYLELVLTDGTSCGFIPLTGTQACNELTVAVGLDGTLTTLDLGSCTASFWPGAFR